MVASLQRQERFNALVRQVEQFAQRQPTQYKWRVGGLAILGYAYIGAIFLALVGVAIAIREPILSALIGLGAIRLFWIKYELPKGIELNRQNAPKLFAILDDLTTTLQAPRFDRVLLTDELNAGVLQVPRLGFLGWYRSYLILGLPLMQALSLDQCRAVLAHELGHLSGNHSRFHGWIYRVRNAWYFLVSRFHDQDQGGSILFRRFFTWYEPFFDAYSFVLRRINEYEADQCAAEVAGTVAKAEALIHLMVRGLELRDRYWRTLYKQVHTRATPPDHVITDMLKLLQRPLDPVDGSVWLGLVLAEKTDNEDTHPCLTDRLAALRYSLRSDQVPLLNAPTAAESCFAAELMMEYAARLDELWIQEAAKGWSRLHRRAQAQHCHLESLEAKAHQQPLTVEETWRQADLTLTLRGLNQAIPLFRQVVEREPHHGMANYQLGKELVDRHQPEGVIYLERAIAHIPLFTPAACERLYEFYRRLGDIEIASRYLERSHLVLERWNQAAVERGRITYQDSFQPHGLPQPEITQLAQQMASYPDVVEAHLVQRQVTVYPEAPLYVLGMIRRFSPGSGATYLPDWEFMDHVYAVINCSHSIHLIVFNPNNTRLFNAMRQIRGSCFYQQGRMQNFG